VRIRISEHVRKFIRAISRALQSGPELRKIEGKWDERSADSGGTVNIDAPPRIELGLARRRADETCSGRFHAERWPSDLLVAEDHVYVTSDGRTGRSLGEIGVQRWAGFVPPVRSKVFKPSPSHGGCISFPQQG
jgi:hypothetical protein